MPFEPGRHSKSERDVRSFLKSGLADEQIRIGAILQELFQVAYDVDWQSQKVRTFVFRVTASVFKVSLEQEFLPESLIHEAMHAWAR